MIGRWIAGCAALALMGAAPWVASGESAAAETEKPARIPTAQLAALPEFSGAKLSPDGQRVLFRRRAGSDEQVAYRNVAGGPISGFAIPAEVDLNWTRWAGNGHVLASIGRNTMFMGEEAYKSVLLLHDIAAGTTSVIGRKDQGLEGDDVLFVDPAGRYLLLSIQRSIYDWPSVFRVSLPDGKLTQIVRARPPVWEWYADDSGIVRAGIGWEGRKMRYYYRRTAEEDFKLIGAVRPDDENAWFDIAKVVSGSDEGYVLSDEKTGRQALYKFNYRTREIGDLVHGNDEYDIDDYWLTTDGRTLEGVSFTDDRERVLWFDPDAKDLQARIDRAVPDLQAWVTSRSADDNRLLILGTAPNDPGVYYVLDRTTREMALLAVRQNALPPEMLAETKAVRYKARDGREIPAYLTLPKGRAAKDLPLIVHPHGGPYGVRDKLEYDAQVQLLANRGYAVLQPNYRGSGGYGTEFGDAGVGQIGLAMQDDLDDGMDWLVDQGIVDKGRVCMVGASYGGYAAMWAAIRNPERYRCAASFAGVADWKAMLKYDRRFLTKKARARWQTRVTGEEERDLGAVSPTQQAARLTRPLLIAHGEDDSNVPISQSKRLVAELRKAGVRDYEYVAYKGEGHGFSDPANQKDWFDRLDAFLAKHNPAE
ncbi:MAG TPA: prolyl oligopeptidase family serine peptidase [Sphingopyxis sp.]|nr:prolyl oligopeptidase family serine peptidase [Sphingopyxis sp.]HMP46391.1 prolyl oligopeptidase family serine peptidase [Sphingopyxis sp.]HMQ18008.1 prolyl oligopeptidase family serine peptidase [Sphingopyxis sp.]